MDRTMTLAARLPISACTTAGFPAFVTGHSLATRGFPGR